MPCRCDWPDDSDSGSSGLRTEADKATRAACDMRTILRRFGLERELTAETRKWIKKHDKEDAARIAEEKERKWREKTRLKALRKLNLEERRVLGL